MTVAAAVQPPTPLRRPTRRHDTHYVYDAAPVRRCRACRKPCLDVSFAGTCRACSARGEGPKSGNGNSRTPNLDAIRAGTWQPSGPLAEYLASTTRLELYRYDTTKPADVVERRTDPHEIAVCAGCGKVRLKPVGRLCGHAGTCEEQARLF